MFENLKLLVSGNYNILKSNSVGAGIYAVSGLNDSGSFKTPIYVGSAIDINYRLRIGHFDALRKDRHDNAPLQNYYNKYGETSLVAFLLEECEDTSKLADTEQKYIDYYGTAKYKEAFNIMKTANVNIGFNHSEETKKRQSERMIGHKPSEETKAKMAAAQLGRTHPKEVRKKIAMWNTGKTRTQRARNSISLKNAEIFHALDLNSGFIYEMSNLKKFCRNNGISSSSFLQTRKQTRRKRCKNWVLMDKTFSIETK